MSPLVLAVGSKGLTLAIFGVVLAITLAITYYAARRTRSAEQFWAAGRAISPRVNGFAIAGDYMSAAAFLGTAGLIYLAGFDGFITGIAALVSYIAVLLLLAERMRNSGKFTMADVLAFRLRRGPARVAAATGTLTVATFYLVAQSIAAGVLIKALAGIDFELSVIITGAFMLVYVLFGGMIATTYVQVVKATLLLLAVGVLTILTLSKTSWNPFELFDMAAAKSKEGHAFLAPGLQFKHPLDTISVGIAFALGTAGLPHILMRFFTVPNARRPAAPWAGRWA